MGFRPPTGLLAGWRSPVKPTPPQEPVPDLIGEGSDFSTGEGIRLLPNRLRFGGSVPIRLSCTARMSSA